MSQIIHNPEVVEIVKKLRSIKENVSVEARLDAEQLQGAIDLLTGYSHIAIDPDKVLYWDASDLQVAHHALQKAEGISPETCIPLTEEQVEDIFSDLIAHERLCNDVSHAITQAVRDHMFSFRVGDEVYWSDPDGDECSGKVIIKSIHSSNPNTYCVVRIGSDAQFEALEHELI